MGIENIIYGHKRDGRGLGFEICSSLLTNLKIIMFNGFPISYNSFKKGFLQ